MTTSADQLNKTRDRINARYTATYKYNPMRCRREFRYSDRRMFKQAKFMAIQAVVTGKSLYVNFLGPSGVTLAAFDGATDSSVETWLRYPVSYRRRMRFFNNLAIYNGATEDEESSGSDNKPVKLMGEEMRVFMGTPEEVTLFINLLKSGADSCVSAAKDSSDTARQVIAKKVCGSQYRKWNNPEEVDDTWNYFKD